MSALAAESGHAQRDFTPDQLLMFNGTAGRPIYTAVCNSVFDVSAAPEFVIGSPAFFCCAGRDASRALALGDFNFDSSAPNYSVDDLSAEQQATLASKLEEFRSRFRQMGLLSVPPSDLVLSVAELAEYRGDISATPPNRVHPPIYIGLSGKVIDVSYGGWDMYNPGANYAIFAGVNASRALGKMSFDPADLVSDDISDLTEDQLAALRNWESKFTDVRRYPIVGRLAAATTTATNATSASPAYVKSAI